MWDELYGWGGPQQYDWGGQNDYMAHAVPTASTYSSYTPLTLPQQFWPSEDQYNRTAEQMRAMGIEPPPRGTLDPTATSALGQGLYEQESWMDSPFLPAMVMMGGAALGGAFANGGAGYGAAGAGYGGSATTYPLASSGGPISASPLAGAGGAGATGVAADGLAPITVGASRLPGGNPAVEAAINSAWGGGGGVLQNLLGGMSGNWGSLIGGLLGAVDAHNQPDSMSSTYAPDPALTGAGTDVLASLRALFANGGPGVAGADPASLAAISGLQNFAGGGGINPYLDTVFNTAADATRGRLSTEFARSGRNVGGIDHQGFRSDELQNLAAGIYGPGFEAERGRQFSSLLPLLGGGDYLRGINQQQIDQPLTNAMRYSGGLNTLLPLFPGTNTQPLFNNPWAGFLGGAQLGSLFSGA